MSKLCDHLWIEQNDKLRGDIIYCQRCDSLVSKEVFATINADAARIAELEANNKRSVKLAVKRGDTCRQLELDKTDLIKELGLRGEEEFQARNRIAELTDILSARNNQIDKQFDEMNQQLARIAELEAILKESCREARATGPYENGVGPCPNITALQADCKAMAEGMIKAHRCTHSGEPESCLLDSGESCSYNNRFTGKCPEFGICTCPACTIAAKYREGKQ